MRRFTGNGHTQVNISRNNDILTFLFVNERGHEFEDTTDVSDWNIAYKRSLTAVSGSGNGTLTLTKQDAATLTADLSHTHDYDDLPMSSTDATNWTEAYDSYISSFSGDGNSTLTITRRDSTTFTHDLSHSHDYTDLPISSTDTTNWNEAYDNYISALSGHGNETVTFTRRDSSTFTHDLSHSHGYPDLPISDTDTDNWNQAYNKYIDSVSGNGNSTVTFTRRDSTTFDHDFSHNHDSSYVNLSGDTMTGILNMGDNAVEMGDYTIVHNATEGRLEFSDSSGLIAYIASDGIHAKQFFEDI